MGDILRRAGWNDYSFIQVASFWPQREYDGRFIPEIAETLTGNGASTLEEQQDLLVGMLARGGAQLIYHEMSVADVDSVFRWAQTSIGSDAAIRTADMDARPHPRGMGTFPRILARYVRTNVVTLPEAVHRMTGLPAKEFGLRGRGTLTPGSWADVVVFDLESVQDRATYEDPLVTPVGIADVLVNGVPVIKDGKEVKRYPGRFLRRGQS
jgi:N-acyl-D-aspartate/D-glutamate deacylase